MKEINIALVLHSSEGKITAESPLLNKALSTFSQTWGIQLDNGFCKETVWLGQFTPTQLADCIEKLNQILATQSDVQIRIHTADGKVGREAIMAIAEQAIQNWIMDCAQKASQPLLSKYLEMVT